MYTLPVVLRIVEAEDVVIPGGKRIRPKGMDQGDVAMAVGAYT